MSATPPSVLPTLLYDTRSEVRTANDALARVRASGATLKLAMRRHFGATGHIYVNLPRQPRLWTDANLPSDRVEFLLSRARLVAGGAKACVGQGMIAQIAVPAIELGSRPWLHDGRLAVRTVQHPPDISEMRDRSGRLLRRSIKNLKTVVPASEFGLCVDRDGRIWS